MIENADEDTAEDDTEDVDEDADNGENDDASEDTENTEDNADADYDNSTDASEESAEDTSNAEDTSSASDSSSYSSGSGSSVVNYATQFVGILTYGAEQALPMVQTAPDLYRVSMRTSESAFREPPMSSRMQVQKYLRRCTAGRSDLLWRTRGYLHG